MFEMNSRFYEEGLRRLRALRPIDDDFMRPLFRDNIPLVQLVLRIITGLDDLIITSCETQADMKRVTGAHSLCLDAYGTDSNGKKYDLEIQRSDKGADPHRARYHSSVMDIENLDAGQDFSELPDTYTIFITEKDFFGRGKPAYHIRYINTTINEPFNDGTHIIYVNGEYRGDDDLGRLMHDFNCCDASDMYYDEMAERTRYYKDDAKGVSEMCKAIEELCRDTYNEGIIAGMTKGKIEGKIDTLCEFVRDGIITATQGAFRAKLSEDEFKEIMKKYGYQPS